MPPEKEKLEYSSCPDSKYQINKRSVELNEAKKEASVYKQALQRIANTYDNIEDLAGSIARQALDTYK
jgi:hypothetical protein